MGRPACCWPIIVIFVLTELLHFKPNLKSREGVGLLYPNGEMLPQRENLLKQVQYIHSFAMLKFWVHEQSSFVHILRSMNIRHPVA